MAVVGMKSLLVLPIVLVLCCLSVTNGHRNGHGVKPITEEYYDRILLYYTNLTVAIDKSPWRLQVFDNHTEAAILSESTDVDKKLGFGLWEGEYLNIYEGYLFRAGDVTRWYHATSLLTYQKPATFVVMTSDTENNATLTVVIDNPRQFQLSVKVNVNHPGKGNRVAMGFNLVNKTEGFYGFGERFNDANQRGHRVGHWLEEGSFGLGNWDKDLRVPKGELCTYAPMPLTISSRGYGLQMDMYHRTVFDSKRWDDVMYIEAEADFFHMTLFAGRTPRDTLQMMTDKNGRSLIPPAWQSVGYFNPMVSLNWNGTYEMAARNDYLLKTRTGEPYNYTYLGYGAVSQLDFTNPAAVTWYQSQLQSAIDMGFRGWMQDYGEYTPPDSVSFDGTDGLEMHNKFVLLYQNTTYDLLTRKYPSSEPDKYAPDFVFYVRSGYTGSQRYTWAHWTGDPTSDWSYSSGLPAQIIASLTAGLSGMPYSGSDIGGFVWYLTPPPSEELWCRWAEVGCFSGTMHEQGSGKGFGEKTHIFDTPEGTRVWRKYAKLRTQLFPYLYNTAHEAYQTGLPVMRHHLLDFPNDTQAIRQNFQYMFGPSFLVAPVIEPGRTDWEVYLPEGETWIDVSSQLKYEEQSGRFMLGFTNYTQGGRVVTVSAPLDVVPMFVRAGTMVPVLDPRVMTLSDATDPKVITMKHLQYLLHLWIWPTEDGFAQLEFHDRSWWSMYHVIYAKHWEIVFNDMNPNRTNILQVSAPWTEKVTNVTTPTGHVYPRAASLDGLLSDGAPEGWIVDRSQHTLWVRAVPPDSSGGIIYIQTSDSTYDTNSN
ncbi:PREDICTED: lysosomal alpha-glucosidase-like [Branchiostoma belcheri]|uniref:Lysosomal alpha-glucosidase-like n=1 Tax=Branchiostoma belcheri TaxID=7741 RepID=A0A6P5A1D8_BRABE|nr:PREDICTED: lysosomal alpha-glucosidase-like [Branchiostoma belcheri]